MAVSLTNSRRRRSVAYTSRSAENANIAKQDCKPGCNHGHTEGEPGCAATALAGITVAVKAGPTTLFPTDVFAVQIPSRLGAFHMTQQNKPQDPNTQNASMQKPQSDQQQQQDKQRSQSGAGSNGQVGQQQQHTQQRGQQGSTRPSGNFAGTQTGKSDHRTQQP